ncbi:unnamed protein product [Gadus morhua 'NCC']
MKNTRGANDLMKKESWRGVQGSKDPSPQRQKTPDQSELESSDEEITNPMLFDLPSTNNPSNPRPNQSGSRSPPAKLYGTPY